MRTGRYIFPSRSVIHGRAQQGFLALFGSADDVHEESFVFVLQGLSDLGALSRNFPAFSLEVGPASFGATSVYVLVLAGISSIDLVYLFFAKVAAERSHGWLPWGWLAYYISLWHPAPIPA